MEQRSDSDEEKERLLKEYELCQDAAQNLESTIWQTSTVIGIGSIGTFLLVVKEHPCWLVAILIGGLVTITNCIWWHMAKRWWSIQHTKFLRMRHIEECVGFGQTRYLQYLDALLKPDEKEKEKEKGSLGFRGVIARLAAFCRHILAKIGVLKTQEKQATIVELRKNYLVNDVRVLGNMDRIFEDLDKRKEEHQWKGVQYYLRWFRWINLVAWILYVLCALCPRLKGPT